MKLQKVLSRKQAIAIMKTEFDKMPFDKDFYIGFLLGAIEDDCFTPPTDWKQKDIDTLRLYCAEAHLNTAEKIVAGELLPSQAPVLQNYTLH